MKIIKPSIEIMRHGMETEIITPEQHIEKVGRTCYKSEDKITPTSAAKFVGGLVKRGHEAMIEHYSLIFKVDVECYEAILNDWDLLMHNTNLELKKPLGAFLRFTDSMTDDGGMRYIVSGNMRGWRDFVKACVEGFGFLPVYIHGLVRNYPLFFPEFQDYVPGIISNIHMIPVEVCELTEYERTVHQNITVKFICDRGVSHNIVRHRTASFAQESTRYCNYSLGKFGGEITVIAPSWCEKGSREYSLWEAGCEMAGTAYFTLLDVGCSPQEARSVLPNSLKTEVIMTGNLDCWEHFFSLRCASDAHPDIQVVAKMVRDKFVKLMPERYNG